MNANNGFDPGVIRDYRDKMNARGTAWVIDEDDHQTDEYVHFYFVGSAEGREVIYDTIMYTLRLQHESELLEIAEQRAAERFPEYNKIRQEEDGQGDQGGLGPLEEEIGLYIAEVIMELEEEESVKVREHVDMDIHADFGIALDVGLNRAKITDADIDKFIKDFNADALSLDESFYSFQTQDSDE